MNKLVQKKIRKFILETLCKFIISDDPLQFEKYKEFCNDIEKKDIVNLESSLTSFALQIVLRKGQTDSNYIVLNILDDNYPEFENFVFEINYFDKNLEDSTEIVFLEVDLNSSVLINEYNVNLRIDNDRNFSYTYDNILNIEDHLAFILAKVEEYSS